MNQKKSYFKWLIWSLAAIFYFYEFILRVSPGVMVPEIMRYFGISASSVGVLSAFYLYGYAPMQLPVGMIVDRFGVKKVLSLASIICGIGAFLFVLTPNISIASVGRLLIGIGSSFAFVSMIFVTTYWFSEGKRAFLIGIANSLAMLGSSIGTGPLSVVIKKYGWISTINVLAVFGVLLGIVVYFVFKINRKEEIDASKQAEEELHFWRNLKGVILNKKIWLNGTVAMLFYITTTAFGGLWGIPFLQAVYHVDKEVASYAVSMIFIGWLVGGPLSGFWSDIIGKRKKVIGIGLLGVLLSLVVLIYFPLNNIFMVYILLFLIGLFSSAELLSFSLAIELNSFKAQATAAAFTNCMISIGDAIVQPFIGFILDYSWDGTLKEGIRIYSSSDFKIAVLCLPIALFIAFILLFFIKEKGFGKKV